MWGRVVKIALSLPFLIAAGVFGTYLIVGFFLINPLAQQLLPLDRRGQACQPAVRAAGQVQSAHPRNQP